MHKLTVELPDSIPEAEARLELAISLYRAARFSQGEAAQMAGYTRRTFIELLSARGGPVSNIDVEDLEQEFGTWRLLASQASH